MIPKISSTENQTKNQWKTDHIIKNQQQQREVSKISQRLNMTQLYYKENTEKAQISMLQQKKQKLKEMHQNLPQINHKLKSQIFSGISFSRFEAISQLSQIQQKPAQKQQVKQTILPSKVPSSKNITNRIPTSTKIISSHKIIEDPIQIKQFTNQLKLPNRMMCQSYSQHEQIIQFNFIQPKSMIQKFINFCKQRQMEIKEKEAQVIAIKKIPLYKSALSLCFPKSTQYENQAYQFTCQTDKYARILHLSGCNRKFANFQDDFLIELWKEKYLVCGSLQQNLKYFLMYTNKFLMKNVNKQNKKTNLGQIDYIKAEAQRIIKKIYQNQFINILPNKQQQNQNLSKKKIQNKLQQLQNNSQLNYLISRIKSTEQMLRTLLQKQMKKQQDLKRQRSSQKNIKLVQEQAQDKLNENQQKKILVTPSIQRMLYSMFYLQLDLQDIVKKLGIQKNITDFQQKKMILKGSLNTADIFKYLELQQFYKSCFPKNSTQSKINILPNSIKILSSLSYSTYSSPNQALQLISIFKNTLLKQIDSLGANNFKVKLQDHNNQDRTLLQFCIYCVVMCDNRDIYSTVQTTTIFSCKKDQKFKIIYEDSFKTLKILKKAIDFVQNQWQL